MEKCYDIAALKEFYANLPSEEERMKMPLEDLRKLCIEMVMYLTPEERKKVLAPYALKYGVDL